MVLSHSARTEALLIRNDREYFSGVNHNFLYSTKWLYIFKRRFAPFQELTCIYLEGPNLPCIGRYGHPQPLNLFQSGPFYAGSINNNLYFGLGDKVYTQNITKTSVDPYSNSNIGWEWKETAVFASSIPISAYIGGISHEKPSVAFSFDQLQDVGFTKLTNFTSSFSQIRIETSPLNVLDHVLAMDGPMDLSMGAMLSDFIEDNRYLQHHTVTRISNLEYLIIGGEFDSFHFDDVFVVEQGKPSQQVFKLLNAGSNDGSEYGDEKQWLCTRIDPLSNPRKNHLSFKMKDNVYVIAGRERNQED